MSSTAPLTSRWACGPQHSCFFFGHYQTQQLRADESLPVEEEMYCWHTGSLPAMYFLVVRNTKPHTVCLKLQVVFLNRSVTLKNYMSILNKHLKKSAQKEKSKIDLLLGEKLENKYKTCQRKDKTVYSNVNDTLFWKCVCCIEDNLGIIGGSMKISIASVSGLLKISTFMEENPKPITGKRYWNPPFTSGGNNEIVIQTNDIEGGLYPPSTTHT